MKTYQITLPDDVSEETLRVLLASIEAKIILNTTKEQLVLSPVSDEKIRRLVEEKLKNRFYLEYYYDYVLLSDDDFTEKHGNSNNFFRGSYEIRFEKEIEVFEEVVKFLHLFGISSVYLLPITANKDIFTFDITDTTQRNHFSKSQYEDFIILDKRLNWLLAKNSYNKLIGIGSFIMKRMNQVTKMSFNGAKIMHTLKWSHSKIESMRIAKKVNIKLKQKLRIRRKKKCENV